MKNHKKELVIDKDICVGCGACIYACPHKAIYFDENNEIKINQNKCKICYECLQICPFKAIKKINIQKS